MRPGSLLIFVLCGVLFVLSGSARANAQEEVIQGAPSPAATLIERYAPILVLKAQRHPCDATGERYVAAPIEIVFGDSAVLLRDGGGRIAATGPTEADLAGLDGSHYLDLPGNPLNPGCVYERRSRERMQDLAPSAMVRLAREEGRKGLAIQYWLFYYFNDWNNTHEGDWELVQVVFEVDTIEDALRTEPIEVGFAQHAGGERASWDDPKLERDGDRPLVYVSQGSHASHFDHAVYLGWGEDGTGFGCDITLGPSNVVPLSTRLVADDAGAGGKADPWLRFDGRWGQRAPWEFNGPRSPHLTKKWEKPISWQEGLRDTSLAVPLTGALGTAPTDAFCRVSAASANLLRLGAERPRLAAVVTAIVLANLAVLLAVVRRPLAGAARLYVGHLPSFLPAAAAVIAVAIGAGLVRYAGEALLGRGPTADAPAVRSAFAFILGLVQQLAGLVLIAPAAVYAAIEARAGRHPGPREVLRAERAYVGRTARASARPLVIIGVLGLIPFGIIPAAYLLVRWLFVPQAVLLDGANPTEARLLSARAVRGRVPRTAGLAAVLAVLVVGMGPIVGVLLLVYAGRSVAVVNLASSLVYALVYPFVFATATLFYLDRQRIVASADPS